MIKIKIMIEIVIAFLSLLVDVISLILYIRNESNIKK